MRVTTSTRSMRSGRLFVTRVVFAIVLFHCSSAGSFAESGPDWCGRSNSDPGSDAIVGASGSIGSTGSCSGQTMEILGVKAPVATGGRVSLLSSGKRVSSAPPLGYIPHLILMDYVHHKKISRESTVDPIPR
jgi:hypothetical protein